MQQRHTMSSPNRIQVYLHTRSSITEEENLMRKQRNATRVSSRRIICIPLLILSLSFGFTACNDYPIQRLQVNNYTEVTDIVNVVGERKVDILFVIDNSDSMKEEQDKLKKNFTHFINKLVDKITDYQIGIITTDMDSALGQGRLQAAEGVPKIIRGLDMTRQQVIDAFVKNSTIGTGGSSYEQGLAAMKAALSPALLNTSNKGFLRDGAMLVVLFVSDEEDCSHGGRIKGRWVPDVCWTPPTEVMKYDRTDEPIKDPYNPDQDLHGKRHLLEPVDHYVDFLKGLKDTRGRSRTVLVSGLIGNPKVQIKDPANPNTSRLIDPAGGCGSDAECSTNGAQHYCGFIDDTGTKRCGGCRSDDANARQLGMRYYQLIQAFTPGVAADLLWYPICGNNDDFQSAMLRFAGQISDRFDYVVLSKSPQLDTTTSNPYLSVTIIKQDGTKQPISQAPDTEKRCTRNEDCTEGYLCNARSVCVGDGWVYYPTIVGGSQARIRLSGTARELSAGGALHVTYVPTK
ncbi:MAG TPA: hypothetical protein DCE42_06730 [Myxococcales bacterium]|nr:hypothetical protein [Myxococcales bacterium]